MLCSNVLKLRKETKLAQEQEEISVMETLTPHEQRGYWSGRRVDDIVSEHWHATLPERKPYTEQDDWREVCLFPFRTCLADPPSLD
jgi:hypothetical protein